MSTTEQNKNDPPIENSNNNEVASLAAGGGAFCFSGTACKPIPPFLLKIHDMLDNNAANCSVISWTCNGTSFVVTNPHSFSDNVLPMYFRHNNFQSFIAQLNSYGFRKISWEHWEYRHEYFRKGERHLLSNIKRRNQIPRPPPSLGSGGAPCRDVAKEVQVMMDEHDQLKVEIETLNDKQEALERKLATLKDKATAINAEKDVMGIVGISEGLLRKRKLSDDDDNNTSCNLASIAEFMSEHFKTRTTTMELDDQTNCNTLISLEDMFGESSSSDWVAYLKSFVEKEDHHLKT